MRERDRRDLETIKKLNNKRGLPIHVHTYVLGKVFDNKFVILNNARYSCIRQEREGERKRERNREKARERHTERKKKGKGIELETAKL